MRIYGILSTFTQYNKQNVQYIPYFKTYILYCENMQFTVTNWKKNALGVQ